MVGKKLITSILGAMISTSILVGCNNNGAVKSKKIANIGVLQFVEHSALDLSLEGFKAGLKSSGLKEDIDFRINFQNAQGNIPTAQTMANDFVSNKKDLIFAIATPAAQAAYNLTKQIPILFTAVTDPIKAELVNSMDKPNTNVTGTSDDVLLDKQFDLIKKLVPTAKKIGILYNPSEVNSELQLKKALALSKDKGFEVISLGVNSSNDMSQALTNILSKVDVLYTPTDNLIASSISLISEIAIAKGVPVFGAEKAHVEGGALASEGIDYYKLGFQTGVMASRIINGENPKDISVETLKETTLIINKSTAKALNVKIPEELSAKATFIKDGGN